MKIVPVAIAVVKVLAKVAKAIANLMGFELPDLNWDSVSIGSTVGDGVSDSLDGATSSAKALKRQLAGFDELNNLTSPTPSSGGGGAGGTGGAGFDLELPEYDMLEGFNKGIDDMTDKIMKFFGLTEDGLGNLTWKFSEMNPILQDLTILLGSLLAIKLITTVANWIKKIGEFNAALKAMTGKDGLVSKAIGVVLTITGITFQIKGIADVIKNGELNWRNVLEMYGGTAMIAAGVWSMTHSLTLTIAITAISFAINTGVALGTAIANDKRNPLVVAFAQQYGLEYEQGGWVKKFSLNFSLTLSWIADFVTKPLDMLLGPDFANFKKNVIFEYQNIWREVFNLINIFDFDTFIKKWGEVFSIIGKGIKSLWDGSALKKWITGKKDGSDVGGGGGAFGGKAEVPKDYVPNPETGKKQSLLENLLFGATDIQNWWNTTVAPWFTSKKWGELFTTAKNGLVTKFNEWKDNFSPISDWWSKHVAPWFTVEKWSELFETGKKGLETAFSNWKTKFKPIKDWWDEHVAPWFTKEKWSELFETGKKGLEEKFDEWKTNFKPIKDWWDEHVAPWFTKKKWEDEAENAKKGITDKFNEWKEKFSPIKDWWDTKIVPWFNPETWKKKAQEVVDAIKRVFSNLNIKLKMPHFSWTTQPVAGWVGKILSALNLPTQIPKLNVSWYAKGGFPNTGEFFMARESGPEMVGRIGNRTAVANNDQIVDGIQQGVYNAMVNAQSEQSSSAQNIYIGNRQVYRSFTNGLRTENNRLGTSVVRV